MIARTQVRSFGGTFFLRVHRVAHFPPCMADAARSVMAGFEVMADKNTSRPFATRLSATFALVGFVAPA
jgi:hypothetical protein